MFCNEEEICQQERPLEEAPAQEDFEIEIQETVPEWNQPAPPKLGWFKFLTNFLLFASTALSLYQAVMYLTGGYYEGGAWEVFQYAPGLQILDLYMSIFCACLSGLALYTRFRLAGFHANGPKLLSALYVVSILGNFVYLFVADAIVEASVLAPYVDLMEDLGTICARSAITLGWLVFNMAYFKKHAKLFVN